MRQCPQLQDLPNPPIGKFGWPWTSGTSESQSNKYKSLALPSICIVTPSFNQGTYLEETIRSVLLQGYPNLEYIIMDGGSTDESISIIQKYADFLTHWESRCDNGQADAIKRGFALGKAEVLGWLNSDDYLMPAALINVGNRFINDQAIQMLIGSGWVVDEVGRKLKKMYSYPVSFESLLHHGQFFNQMSTFWKRDLYNQVGAIDDDLRFCFDYDLFLRLAKATAPNITDKVLSSFRLHGGSKTSTIWNEVAVPEARWVKSKYLDNIELYNYDQVNNYKHSYHRSIRTSKIKDAYRDPAYFFKQIQDYALNRLRIAP